MPAVAAVDEDGECPRIGRAPTPSGARGEREPKLDWTPATREAAAKPRPEGLEESRLRWLTGLGLGPVPVEMGTP